MIKITKAKIGDVAEILSLVTSFAEEGLMLKRSEDEVLQNLRDYFVARERSKVVGVASLHIYTDRLSEIKALAVSREYQGQGIALRLVKRCLQEAKDLGLIRVFTLTYVSELFEKMNFKLSDKNELPEKIWQECSKCLKRESCDETCLEYQIT